MAETENPNLVQHLGVGIDTARYGHHVTFLRDDRQTASPAITVTESRQGYQHLQRQLIRLQRRHPHVHFHIRIDAAGQYATNLESFLRTLPLPTTISIGEPQTQQGLPPGLFSKTQGRCH